jgi:hypothetical protein
MGETETKSYASKFICSFFVSQHLPASASTRPAPPFAFAVFATTSAQQIRLVLGALYGFFLGVRNETRGITAALFGFNLVAFGKLKNLHMVHHLEMHLFCIAIVTFQCQCFGSMLS